MEASANTGPRGLQHVSARALFDQVRHASRNRFFLVRFRDDDVARAAGLPPPVRDTPRALKDLLLPLTPQQHEVVRGSNNPFLQRVMPALLAMGVCLVKRSSLGDAVPITSEEYAAGRKRRAEYLQRIGLTDERATAAMQRRQERLFGPTTKRTRRNAHA